MAKTLKELLIFTDQVMAECLYSGYNSALLESSACWAASLGALGGIA